MPLPPPGWMPDPSVIGVERYWDGSRWTGRTRDAATRVEGAPPSWREALPSDLAYGRPNGARPYAPAAAVARPRSRFSWARVLRATALVSVCAVALVVVDTPLSRALRDSEALPAAVPVAALDVSGAMGVEAAPVTEPSATPVEYPLAGSTALVRYLEAAMIAREESIDVRYWTRGADGSAAVEDAMHEALTQNPYVFVQGWQQLTLNGQVVSLEPTYVYDAQETARRQVATRAAVDTAVTLLAVDGLAPADQARAIHDYVARAATYDYGAADLIDAGVDDARVAASQEAFGILVSGTAVCNGYAQAFKAIADAVGLPTVTVTGEAWSGVTSGGHAWNRVLVDGSWLVVDVTWDDGGDPSPAVTDYLLVPAGDPVLSTRRSDAEWAVDASLPAHGG